MRACICPNCRANLTFEDNDREFAFCQYCGTKIMLDDYRSVHKNTYHIVDEARIRESEVDKTLRLKELEMKEKEQEHADKVFKTKIVMTVILLILTIVSLSVLYSIWVFRFIGLFIFFPFTIVGFRSIIKTK